MNDDGVGRSVNNGSYKEYLRMDLTQLHERLRGGDGPKVPRQSTTELLLCFDS